jgi:hypothetical protein
VKAKFGGVRPKFHRKLDARLLIEPRSKRYMVVGSAFDYLLRFELQRLAPHAVANKWVAEDALGILWRETATGSVAWDIFAALEPQYRLPPHEVASRVRKILQDSRAAVTAYLNCKAPKRARRAELAGHAIRLAKLDDVGRAWRLDPRFEEADPEDVGDLLSLLAIVPFESLLHAKLMLLNPRFPCTAKLFGAADADLIAGDMLLDFKVTKYCELTADNLDQLLGYLLLARHERRLDPTFPTINRLGLYFCRHGLLWVQNAAAWANHPQFSQVEEWFFEWLQEAAVQNERVAAGKSSRVRMPTQ